MSYALVTGSIFKIETKVSRQNKPYTNIVLRETIGTETLFWRIRVFSESLCKEVEGLSPGDAISATGRLTAEIWTPLGGEPRVSMSMAADRVMPLTKPKSASSCKAAAAKVKPLGEHWADHRTTAPIATGSRRALDEDEIPF